MLKASTLRALRFAPLLALAVLFGCGEGDGGGGGAPVISSFSANPATVAVGGSTTLSWAVTGNPTSLEISGIGAVSGTNVVVQPTATTTYTLTATNGSGTASASTAVTVGGTLPGPGVEDGLPPSGSFGVSLSQTGPFQSDATGNITSGTDERVVTVAGGGTFYASVSYSDPGGIAGVSVRIANQTPAGLAADLTPGVPVGGFTLGAEVTGCVLDGTQTAVTCIYPITVAAGTQNISSLTPTEFAYVFRTNVTDAAGNRSDSPPRGYVVVGSGSGGGGGGGGGGGQTAPTINSFSANPTSITSGASSTLSWNVTGTVTALSINNGVGSVTGTASRSVSPTATTTYTLTASNGSASTTRTATVTVGSSGGGGGQTAPTITTFTVNGQSAVTLPTSTAVTLAWGITGTATEVTISPAGGGNLASDSDKQLTVTPTATTTYTINARNGTSAAPSKSVTVTVGGGGGNGADPVAEIDVSSGNTSFVFADLLTNKSVTLSGSDSSDAEDDAAGRSLSYQWTVSGPSGSTARPTVVGGNPALVSFTPDKIGQYRVTLRVIDSNQNTDDTPQTVMVATPSLTIDGLSNVPLNSPASYSLSIGGGTVSQDVTTWSLNNVQNPGTLTGENATNGITYNSPNVNTSVELSVKINDQYVASGSTVAARKVITVP